MAKTSTEINNFPEEITADGVNAMSTSCIIVDDEPLAINLLESYVNKTPGLKLLYSFTDSVKASKVIKEQKPDILLLDIQMPDLNGIELAHMVPLNTKLIFTTAFKEYAFDSYEVNAIDYLLKPIRYNKFLLAIDKARERLKMTNPHFHSGEHQDGIESLNSSKPSTIFLKVNGEYRQIAVDKILYVCGLKDYVKFVLEDEKIPLITYLRMKSVEKMLPFPKFMRIHRSYIVALDKIKKVDRNDCVYIKDEVIHVTDAFRCTFHKYLTEHEVLM